VNAVTPVKLSVVRSAAIVVAAIATARAGVTPVVNAQQNPALRQTATVPLTGVKGRIDHLALDAARQHLFVAALGNDTVEVVDTAGNRPVRSLTGFHEPQGIAVAADANVIAIANGDSGTLQLLAADTLQTRATTPIGGDADNVRYDAGAHRFYVAAEGGLYAVDPATGKVAGRIQFNGHPESFQLESNGPRVFANLPGASLIVVGDRSSSSVVAKWPTTDACHANYPMAIDAAKNRVFVGCRRPAAVAVFEMASGRVITTVPAVGDTDDMFIDSARRRLYVIGGEGFIDVIDIAGEAPARIGRVTTAPGARTGLWVEDHHRLYLAVPARGGQPAELRVFEP
jgi:DNA-binding beta-propeller fold protein YncE